MASFLNLTYRLKSKLKRYLTGSKPEDDFDWQYYTYHYRAELEKGAAEHTLMLKPGDYVFENDRLTRKSDCLPLHPNHRLLYETILQLRPPNVTEIGAGGGDHLGNLSVLAPSIQLNGIDLSADQLALARQRHPDLRADLRQFDLTGSDKTATLKVTEVAYTQAVIMHIRSYDRYLQALINSFHLAEKKLVLMENWGNHEFMEDIQTLFHEKKLPWKSIHFHYRESEELKRPHLMIVSTEPLPKYPTLTDYSIFR